MTAPHQGASREDTNTQIALLIQETRLSRESLERWQKGQEQILADLETRLRKVEETTGTLKERLTAWQIFQVTFTTLTAGVVAYFKH